jgi:hypothetical protein
MPKRDPLTYPKNKHRLDALKDVYRQNSKRPYIGITQGGSSRKARGAKVAATSGQVRQS